MPLYVIATPIGNLKDITLRALEILKEVDLLICEDTRRTKKLLSHYSIQTRELTSLNEANETRKVPHIIKLLEEGKRIGLVSDNGTPAICDPGRSLISACHDSNIQVIPVPGPNALAAALSISGLYGQIFEFYGFLPKKKSKRDDILTRIQTTSQTVILYESPHRMDKTLQRLAEVAPNKQLVICRELTKVHEEVIKGTIKELAEKKREWRGEFVLLIAGEQTV